MFILVMSRNRTYEKGKDTTTYNIISWTSLRTRKTNQEGVVARKGLTIWSRVGLTILPSSWTGDRGHINARQAEQWCIIFN